MDKTGNVTFANTFDANDPYSANSGGDQIDMLMNAACRSQDPTGDELGP